MMMIANLKIGPMHFTVVEKDDLHTVGDDGKKQWLHGHILWSQQEIRVDKDQAEERKVVTLWHEALHGVLDQADIDEHPEQVIRVLGFGIVQLIRDNPELVRLTLESGLLP